MTLVLDGIRQEKLVTHPQPGAPAPGGPAPAPARAASAPGGASPVPSRAADNVDALIVGAGPVGLYAAYYAGFRGLSVGVLDSLPEIGGQVSGRCRTGTTTT